MSRAAPARALAAFAPVLLALGCGRAPGAGAGSGPAHLARGLARADGVDVVVADEAARARALALAEQAPCEVRVVAPGEDADPRRARVVVGRFGDAHVRPLLERAGAMVTTGEDGADVEWQGLALAGEGDALLLSFEDPARPGLPLSVVAAGGPRSLPHLLTSVVPSARPDARAVRRGQPAASCRLAQGGAPLRESLRDLEASRARALGELVTLERRGGVNVERTAGVEPERAARYVEELLAARARAAERLGVEDPPRLRVTIVHDAPTMLAATGRVALCVPDPLPGGVTVLLARGVPDDRGAGAAAALARAALGPPARAWTADAAGVAASGSWWGRELRGWGARVAPLLADAAAAADPGADADADADADDTTRSEHVLAPLRALLWERATAGDVAAARELWTGARAWSVAPDELEALRAELAPEMPPRARGALPDGFLAGICLDSDARPGGGYATPALRETLASAAARGARAVSIASFFVAAPRDAGGLEALEGDATLAWAAAEARATSPPLAVALRPELLLSDGGPASGWLKRTDAAEWEAWFDELGRCAEHYALLAELLDADLLCLAADLGKASVGNPDEETLEAVDTKVFGWASTIARARACWDGPLTYAARWPLEARAVGFWDELDVVSVVLWPRLVTSEGARRDDPAIARGLGTMLREVAELGAAHGRPALVLETGFAARARAWRETEVGAGAPDVEEQARLYEDLADGLARARAAGSAPAGLFLRGWPADPRAATASQAAFSPLGRPADAALRRLWER